ncbi:MAG: class I SAM-dependent methyltransferase [Ramlibacter sp.]
MDQSKIWDHYQNPGVEHDVFSDASPRYRFLARQAGQGAKVLNIGVGRGGLEALMVDNGAVVSCLDPSEKAVDFVRTAYGLGDRAKTGFSQAMPFGAGEFEVVVMSEVLEHLSDDVLDATLGEVNRVLKPGGRFVGTVPANENLASNLTLCPHCGESFHRWGHMQSFSPHRMRDMLHSHGFDVRLLQLRAFPDWQRPGLANLVKSTVRHVLGRTGSPITNPNIYFEAQTASQG